MIPWWRIELGENEIEAVAAAIRDRHINQGPLCRQFEEQLAEQLGVPHAVTCCNGSSALYLALAACGVEANDEVIMPALSYIATAHAVLLRGAVPRLVDVRPDRPLIDPAKIDEAVTPRTRAIVVVHLNGAACDMAAIKAIATRHQLRVIEDAAQAFGSAGPFGPLGTLGDAGCFSLSMAKLMTTGEGGFAVTRNADTHQQILKIRNHGVLDISNNRFPDFGFNFRLTDMLAAVGLTQLRSLEQKIETAKRTYNFYRNGLQDLRFLRMMEIAVDAGEVPLWCQVYCADRQRIIDLLEERGIQSRPLNPPLCDSPQLRTSGAFPNARRLGAAILGLPSGPHQDASDLQRVVDVLHEISDQLPDLETGPEEQDHA